MANRKRGNNRAQPTTSKRPKNVACGSAPQMHKKRKEKHHSSFTDNSDTGGKKKLHCSAAVPLTNLTDERLKAYGINPKKFKNKLKYGSK